MVNFDILQERITAFKGCKGIIPYKTTVGEALKRIKIGTSRRQVEIIRETSDKAEKDLLKENLLAFTFAGHLTKRRATSVRSFSGFTIIDIDKIEPNLVETRKKEVMQQHSFVVATWRSPSGNGLKVLCIIDIANSTDDYKYLYKALLKEFSDADKQTSSPASLCYESVDELLLFRSPEQCSIFIERDIPTGVTPPPAVYNEFNNDFDVYLEKAFKFIESGFRYINFRYEIGNRNNFIFRFASQCCEFGISEKDCREYIHCTQQPPTDVNANYAISSGYRASAHKAGILRYKLNY